MNKNYFQIYFFPFDGNDSRRNSIHLLSPSFCRVTNGQSVSHFQFCRKRKMSRGPTSLTTMRHAKPSHSLAIYNLNEPLDERMNVFFSCLYSWNWFRHFFSSSAFTFASLLILRSLVLFSATKCAQASIACFHTHLLVSHSTCRSVDVCKVFSSFSHVPAFASPHTHTLSRSYSMSARLI